MSLRRNNDRRHKTHSACLILPGFGQMTGMQNAAAPQAGLLQKRILVLICLRKTLLYANTLEMGKGIPISACIVMEVCNVW
ncbi:hypothetical protein [Silvimonas iriomotensis]|uniref:hypothetical protein n=1 Tax=Silvimonas iriomotensis TaxID=449662 RepID=UPI0016694886|nr:hypothetical protein [Silvimonas iriomotensis]